MRHVYEAIVWGEDYTHMLDAYMPNPWSPAEKLVNYI